MQISKDELVSILKFLAVYLDERAPDNIVLSTGYYWDIDGNAEYDMSRNPSPEDFSIGDLTHDWDRLQRLLSEPDMAVPSVVKWAGDLLRGLGKEQTTSGSSSSIWAIP